MSTENEDLPWLTSDALNVVSLSGKRYKELQRFAIYVIKRDDEYLYLGKSKNGFYRAFDPNHHALTKIDIQDTDVIEVRFYDSLETIDNLEVTLVQKFKPIYNIHNKKPPKQNKQNREVRYIKLCPTCIFKFRTSNKYKSYCSIKCKRRDKKNSIKDLPIFQEVTLI